MKLTVNNSQFRPDAEIKISGYQYSLLTAALEDAFEAVSDVSLEERYKYIYKNGEPIPEGTAPSSEQLESGSVVKIVDIHTTFNPKNVKKSYSGKVTLPMLEAKRELYEIHEKGASDGITVSLEDLQKEFEQGNLEVVKDV